MQIRRVNALPGQLAAETVYLVKNGTSVDITVTGASGAVIAESKASNNVIKGNNLGALINNIELQFMNQKLHDNGGSYTLNLANGNYQRFAPTSNGTASFTGFTSGKLGILLVKGVGLGSRTITWPAAVKWMKDDGTFTTVFAETNVTLQTGTNVDFIQFWSDDGGTTIWAKVFR